MAYNGSIVCSSACWRYAYHFLLVLFHRDAFRLARFLPRARFQENELMRKLPRLCAMLRAVTTILLYIRWFHAHHHSEETLLATRASYSLEGQGLVRERHTIVFFPGFPRKSPIGSHALL